MKYINFILLIILTSCASERDFYKTVSHVDMKKFMTDWYVIAGRLTVFEDGAHNAVESYKWNKKKQQVDINFTMRKGSFSGELKSIPQKGYILNKKTNAYWSVSPFWPLSFDYLVIDIATDYSWTVVGVPSQKWVWIMAKDWKMSDEQLESIILRITKKGYSTKAIKRVPQKW